MANNMTCALVCLVLFASNSGLATEMTEDSLRAADAEQMRIIVDGDATAQDAFMHENYILNGPSNRVLRKPVLVDMLAQGKMASESFERVIEGTAITGHIGIVMGSETVRPATHSELGARFGDGILNRRFTNIFIFEHGQWQFLARQASVVGAPGN